MALFLGLYLGHLLGDFVFQPGRLVLAKRSGTPGLLIHTAIIGVTCTAVLAGQLGEYWSAILLIVAAHAGIELITIAAYHETPTRGLFTFALDQAMHILSIALVVWLSGAWALSDTAPIFGIEASVGEVCIIVALVAVGFLGSIFVFEAANAILLPRGGKNVILRLDGSRVVGIVERAGSLVLAIWVSAFLMPLAFLPRLLLSWRMPQGARPRRLIELGAGLSLCLLAYLLLVAAQAAMSQQILPT